MAIDNTGISSLDAGALDITYSGDEGPKSPNQIAGGEYNRVLELLEKVRENIPLSEEEKMELQGLIQTLTAKGIDVETLIGEELTGGSGDMRMASADPILQDEYDKYVFELQEMHPEAVPMSIEQFKQQAVAGMADGGIMRTGFFTGMRAQEQRAKGPAGGATRSDGGFSDRERFERQAAQRAAALQASRGAIGRTETVPPSMRGGAEDALWTPPVTTGGESPFAYTKPPVTPVPDRNEILKDLDMNEIRKNVQDLYLKNIFSKRTKNRIDPRTGEPIDDDYNGGLAGIDTSNLYADINMPVSGLVNYEQFKENITDWPGMGLEKQFIAEGLDTPAKQKEFFDIFEPSLRKQSRGLTHGTPKITTDQMIEAGLIKAPPKKTILERIFGADGGIARLGYANGQLVQPGPGRPGYKGRFSDPRGMSPGTSGTGGMRGETARETGIRRAASRPATPAPAPAPDFGFSPGETQARGIGVEHHGSTINRALDKRDIERLKIRNLLEGTESRFATKVPGFGFVKPPPEEWWGSSQDEDPETRIDDRKLTLKDKYKSLVSDKRKKDILRNMFYYARGKPIQPALMAMLQGGMTEEDFKEEFGISISDLANLSPMHSLSKMGNISQTDTDRLRDMAGYYGQDYLSQSDFEKAFYGAKGPPTGGPGEGGPEYDPDPCKGPNPPAYCFAGAEPTLPVEPEPDPDIPVVPDTGTQADDPFQFALSQDAFNRYYPGGKPTSGPGWSYKDGFMQHQFAADGGRIGYAGGGITDLRQGYFLGDLVKGILKPFKGITRGLKKFSKSKAGKLALMAALGYGTGMFGSGAGSSWLSNLGTKLIGSGMPQGSPKLGGGTGTGWLGKLLLSDPSKAWGLKNISPWKSIGLMSMLPLLQGKQDDENEYWKWHQAEKDRWLGEFPDIPYKADGGRIRYSEGKNGKDDSMVGISMSIEERWERIKKLLKQMEDLKKGVGIDPKYDPPEDKAMGGRIGYAGGGNDEDHRAAALSAMYGLRRNAQEGGLMDMGGMEKDYRNEGGFVPIGGQERADDVPARLSKNEFVFTADAVRAAGGGDIDAGAEVMENVMENLEQGGQVSEESQGLEGARNMFATAQRLEGVL